MLTRQDQDIIRAIHTYRYMTAIDVATLLFSPSSLTYVRSLLKRLAGGEDQKPDQFLYRFKLPSSGNPQRVFTLGRLGREFLEREIGIPVDWHFRPEKVRGFSYNQVLHNLILTRFLVAARTWSKTHPDYCLSQIRMYYELAKEAEKSGSVVPDAWLLFERRQKIDGINAFPILLEIDRGMEHQQKFKQHVRGRMEFIKKDGAYSRIFGTPSVTIVYATTGTTPEYREARRHNMSVWTLEVLQEKKAHWEQWAAMFRFGSLEPDRIYETPLFDSSMWYQPGATTPVSLLSV
jgi:hypothetical protein